MQKATRVFAFATCLILALAGCRRKAAPDGAQAAASASAAPKKALRGVPKSVRELPTTEAAIYLGNLDGQIKELERLLHDQPENGANLQRLSGLHHLRGRYRGDSDEIKLGIDEAGACIKLEPDNAAHVLMRAEQEQSLHRFKEARADLEAAKKLGVDRRRSTDLETELDWNDGLYDKAIPAIRKARQDRPSTATWMREAQLDHDLGQEAEADAAFEAAEDMISDTAPLPVAHLDVQRGIQHVQRGLLDQACVFFRAAIARMPDYVAANEHLAETLHMLGKDDEATAIYEKVVTLTSDPEFSHALGELYAAHGKEAQARDLAAKAQRGYDALLTKYPEAMYWHASEFYSAIGDTKRALELLRKNVILRPNSTSYVALARAELANGNAAEAKKAIDTALAMPLRSASLFWTAAKIARSAGDATAADSFRDRAKSYNPRIETDEPG